MAPIGLKFGPGSSPGRHGLDGTAKIINGYAEALTNGKSEYAIYPAPGLKPWTRLDQSSWRGWIEVNGRLLIASGRVLYESDALGNVIEVAGLPGDGPVQFAKNAIADPDVMMVADGRAYHWKGGTLAALETDILPSLVGVILIRGRFMFAAVDGRCFYTDINSINIDGLSFSNAEGKPDGLVKPWGRRSEAWLLGTETTELWSPTEDENDPFSPLGGGALPIGCLCPGSVAENNDDIFWIDNKHQVRRATGMQPKEISPPWVVRVIQNEPDKQSIVGTCYSVAGANWYEISGSTFTLRYSLDAGHWVHRQTGDLPRWRGQGSIDFAGKTLIGDYASGDIWELDANCHDDGDTAVVMRLQSPLVHASPGPISIYSLHADIIPSVGGNSTDPEIADPKAMLRMSYDGGKSWTRPLTARLGKQGEYRRVIWRQLGTYERGGVTFEIAISSKVAKCVMDCQINGLSGSA